MPIVSLAAPFTAFTARNRFTFFLAILPCCHNGSRQCAIIVDTECLTVRQSDDG